ncbi:hypothetical protein CEUSTIGMA_g2520.t1 [Chlamydomonas eustigma]|uniref:Uncharacterized protein n=1 Tax=Chlamydomonas eustigma TaxID=1157962 RepID=A0A250WWD9_9CHLO|nr:hypothetical protein CEUSTIGMA_g2520.t1 [Chlamydomonas eustigma]|eukprot:GAX75076.1 hypothetical protein CEUSTIGMA_g2520.t1 [Chlamydomonas eustigma]
MAKRRAKIRESKAAVVAAGMGATAMNVGVEEAHGVAEAQGVAEAHGVAGTLGKTKNARNMARRRVKIRESKAAAAAAISTMVSDH